MKVEGILKGVLFIIGAYVVLQIVLVLFALLFLSSPYLIALVQYLRIN